MNTFTLLFAACFLAAGPKIECETNKIEGWDTYENCQIGELMWRIEYHNREKQGERLLDVTTICITSE